MGSGKTRSFFSWLLLASFSFLLYVVFSPNPYEVTPQKALNQREDPKQKPANSHDAIKGEMGCDFSKGKWVRDPGGPAYTNTTCRTLPESKSCVQYGKDPEYLNWRWKPNDCELPRFDARMFLDIVRGKRMAFAGDSVARNQLDSLLCLLSQVETPLDVHKDAEDKFRTWYFKSYDFTIMKLWTRFLVEETERQINGSASGLFDLHLDRIDTKWTEKLPLINYLVISDGHWFFRKNYLYEGGKLIGCMFCSEANLTDLGINYTVQRAFRTTLEYLSKCEKCEGLLTFLRTFTPAHFENGTWNDGGNCRRTRPVNEGDVSFSGTDWELRNVQVEEVKKLQVEKQKGAKRFMLLDVTEAMMMRPDAHPGTHWNNQWMRGYNDCLHWCLPGPIDMWNDLLFAVLKEETP
ncbi:xyloglucan O-acetyltransferase 3 [Elaeis guineensis]|uniref:Protein ALTERED XYLOGLUCAN 4-like n=1 Tax=Elaeis guineensis var. tenera TaxID=51953 RepID=A0A6I9RL96_ELAGV|nr:protein ALTERED XYLOGLUCAN 4-like [Elaeis guineensis]